jgi:uncharacterized repeat protein (TIGR01451 family)
MKKLDTIFKFLFIFTFVNVSYGQVGPYFGGPTCATAVPIEIGIGYITNNILGDDWYSFEAPCDGHLVIEHCGEGDNKQKIIYSGSCGSLVTEKTAPGDDCSTNDLDGPLFMIAGETVFIQMDDTWDTDDIVFNVFFDNLYCPKPVALSSFPIAWDELLVAWFAGGAETNWILVYGPTGFELGVEGDTILDFGLDGAHLTDLDELTCYDIYVAADCGVDGVSCFRGPLTSCTPELLADLDIEGTVYFDQNENGIQDLGEEGINMALIVSDPGGVFCSTRADGDYSTSTLYLEDGVYEIYPIWEDHWAVTSDSLVYTIINDIAYEPRDSLDFGLYPDTLIYQVNTEFFGGWRCNDTTTYWLNIQNSGTTIVSGLVHLELDDSLYYISADILPDSVVGQHIYWYYEDLFYFDNELIGVQVGTPDGMADTVSSTLTVGVDSAGVEVYSTVESFTRVITCAYDPNDKTPDPFGEGELGYIPPSTEKLEYLVRFQNTGTDTAFNVIIRDQLDPNLDWYSLTPLVYSHDMSISISSDGEVSFKFIDIMLPDSNVNEAGSNGFVKYEIKLNEGLPLGTSIYNTANIYFDYNPAIVTNTTVNTLHLDEVSIAEITNQQQILVYPNPFSESTTVYFGEGLSENCSLHIVDLLGNQVYFQDRITGNSLEIKGSSFTAGVYIIVVQDLTTNEVYTKKMVVN